MKISLLIRKINYAETGCRTFFRNLKGLAAFLLLSIPVSLDAQAELHHFPADHPEIRYTGRSVFTDSQRPRFYQPGAYMEARFAGPVCRIIIRDQQLRGENQNYLQVIVDGRDTRVQTEGTADTFLVAAAGDGPHDLVVCKNSEASIGWIEFGGLICQGLSPLPAAPERKIEFIGNSITCAAGADDSSVPCGTGNWHDQHNAYHGYGPTTARALGAQWHLSAVSGIGLIHSCCEIKITMPAVYHKVDLWGDSLEWDFTRYQPGIVTVCLGQNDGIQDSTAFCEAYIQFVRNLRKQYPAAEIILLSSPMGNAELTAVLAKYLAAVVGHLHASGEDRVDQYVFKKQYTGGCDTHPDLEDHRQIAEELTLFISKKPGWARED